MLASFFLIKTKNPLGNPLGNRQIFKRFSSTLTDEERRWATNFKVSDIQKKDLIVKYVRASGPGGQNVNKVSSKCDLRVSVNVPWIPNFVKQTLKENHSHRLNKRDEIVISSDKFRSQPENLDDALDKLHQLLLEAGQVAKETDPATKQRIEEYRKLAAERLKESKKFEKQKRQEKRWKD